METASRAGSSHSAHLQVAQVAKQVAHGASQAKASHIDSRHCCIVCITGHARP